MSLVKLLIISLISEFLILGTLDRIQRALDKKEYEKAEELILKGYDKEPENPGIPYYHAVLLFEPDYPNYNPDSARVVISHSIRLFDLVDDKMLIDIRDEGVTRDLSVQLSKRIRDFQFQKTLSNLSLNSIFSFRDKYPGSPYDSLLIFKRDSLIFTEVRQINTITDYSQFILDYPNSIFVDEADSIRDALRFYEMTSTGNLKDHYDFLKKFPETRWRRNIEEYVLRNSTASHTEEKYVDFIQFSDDASLQKIASDYLFYLSPQEAMKWHPLKDSIKWASQMGSTSLIPVLKGGLFGFMSHYGNQLVDHSFTQIESNDKCQIIQDDWLFVRQQRGMVISKSGQTVISEATAYENLSHGLAIIEQNGQKNLYHKSGFKIMDSAIEEAEVLQGKWVKIKMDGKWGLYTFLGIPIAQSKYDEIYVLGDFWVFKKGNLLGVYTEEHILNEIEEGGLLLEFKFEDLELVNDSLVIGFRGDRECLMDKKLDFLVPWGTYEIFTDASGWYLKSYQGYQIYNNTDDRVIDRLYPYLESNLGWLALKTGQDWMLIPRTENLSPTREYDSLKLINQYSVLTFKDAAKELLFANGNIIELEDHVVEVFSNHTEFISITNDGAIGVYNQAGELIIDGKYEEVSLVNDSLFRVSIRGKQGLVNSAGSFVINPLFDALDERDGLILTLLKGKIGCYDLENAVFIEPNFEARIERIGENYLVKKDGKYGIIDVASEALVDFGYDKIEQWNDTTFLISSGISYSIINQNEEVLTDEIERLQLLFSNDSTKIYRFVKDGKFGLLSNQTGVMLQPEYTDLLFIGNSQTPVFFADQHLSKAGYHVVSYFDVKGEVIFSKAYQSEEFDKILCEDW